MMHVMALGMHRQEQLVSRRWGIAGLLFAAGLINYFDRTIISVAMPEIAKDLALSPTGTGWLLSAFFWSYALMQVPIGWVTDRYNLRWLYPACFGLWSFTCGLTGFAGGLASMFALRVALGIGESIYLPGGMKMVSVLFPPKDRGLASGLVNCGTRAGLAFGAPLIAAIVVAAGWKNTFFILGFGSLLWLAPWFWFFPKHSTSVPEKPADVKWTWKTVDRNLLGMSLAHVGYGYYFYLMVTWLPSYLVKVRHLSLQEAGGYAVVPYLTFTIGEPVGGWLADRLIARGWDEMVSRKLIITIAYITSILLIPAAFAETKMSMILLLGAASLVGLSTANIFALVQRITPAGGGVGFSIGVLNLAGNLSGVAAPIITGMIIESTGSYTPAFIAAVVILVSVIPLYWFVVKGTASLQPSPSD